jgi:hypothetical protein
MRSVLQPLKFSLHQISNLICPPLVTSIQKTRSAAEDSIECSIVRRLLLEILVPEESSTLTREDTRNPGVRVTNTLRVCQHDAHLRGGGEEDLPRQ